MKISLNWLKQFTDIEIPVDELVQKIGAQLGAVEEVIDLGAKYQGIVIAKVVSCVDHPNADRLHVCMIDDGGVVEGVARDQKGLVQVVCGAPNVREGLSVAWLPPGSIVPASFDTDPFVLESRELRGVVSNGMLASSKELAIGNDHKGILEIDIDATPGTSFAEIYELNDYIIDIENKMFTHRPDCFGILGVAREVAGIQQIGFTSPEWYLQVLDRIKPQGARLPLAVKNEIPTLVPRFMAVAMTGVRVAPSPIIMQTYLNRVGIRPINNVVDITNYLMALTGQPLHAYDYDKVAAKSGDVPTLVARLAQTTGEDIALLNGKTAKLESPAVVIATDRNPVGVGGVMGGADTEVDDTTTNIIVECANFDMYSIRKTSMKYGLFTDAVSRFNKGQSPLQNDRILEEAVVMVQALSGAAVASDVYDVRDDGRISESVKVTADFVNDRLGLSLELSEIKSLLQNVEFTVHMSGDAFMVTAPFWRTDIEIAEDIVEEIGRLYGFDKLNVVLPMRSLRPVAKDVNYELKRSIRNFLSRAGANEVLTYSFVHGKLFEQVGQDVGKAYRLSNALSPELQYFRLSLTPSLLEKVYPNSKAGQDEFALFELNKTHDKSAKEQAEPDLPAEHERLCFVYAADKKTELAPYYVAKYYLDELVADYAITLQYRQLDGLEKTDLTAPFEPARAALVYVKETGTVLGVVGEYNRSVVTALKLPEQCSGFEIDTAVLSRHVSKKSGYRQLPRFPKVFQDITLKVPSEITHQSLCEALQLTLAELEPQNSYSSLHLLDIYQKPTDASQHVTFRYVLASYERTLSAVEVNTLLDRAAVVLAEQFEVARI